MNGDKEKKNAEQLEIEMDTVTEEQQTTDSAGQ